MPCINCYINWLQEYAPIVAVYIAPVILSILISLGILSPKKQPPLAGDCDPVSSSSSISSWSWRRGLSESTVVPTYGPSYLPGFICGILAAYRLGLNETEFLVELVERYGPVVYLPWPLKQTLVLDEEVVQRVYDTSSKISSFLPIRKEMQTLVFGGSNQINFHPSMQSRIFPAHARGLTKNHLEGPLSRFATVVQLRVDALCQMIEQDVKESIQIDLISWVTETMFRAAVPALYGNSLLEMPSYASVETLRQAFNDFDTAFPLLASGMIPQPFIPLISTTKKGIKGREFMADNLSKWIKDGMPGLEEGVIKDLVDIGLEEGWSEKDMSYLAIANFWALQANAPFAAVWLLVHLLQSEVKEDVIKEVNELVSMSENTTENVSEKVTPFSIANLNTSMPLLTSCIHETLRLSTSSFSIRNVEQPFFLSTASTHFNSQPSTKVGNGNGNSDAIEQPIPSTSMPSVPDRKMTMGYAIPSGTQIVCATRVGHISEKVWGPNSTHWDGRRFLCSKDENEVDDVSGANTSNQSEERKRSDQNGEKRESMAQKLKKVHGFGGGISICEGRSLAILELKTIAAVMLSHFDIQFPAREINHIDKTNGKTTTMTTTEEEDIVHYSDGKIGFKPRVTKGRVGMGVFQFEPKATVMVTVSKRRQPKA